MNLSDEYLMLKVKEGDTDRMALLFERYHLELYNFFLKFSRNKDLSEDLTQNVFYRILKYKKSYRENDRFRTWMYKIARNARIDTYHKDRFTSDTEDLERVENTEGNERSEIDKKEEKESLERALSQMKEDSRELIVMSIYLEISTHEIAEVLNITENNTRVKIHRALNELRSIYNKMSKL